MLFRSCHALDVAIFYVVKALPDGFPIQARYYYRLNAWRDEVIRRHSHLPRSERLHIGNITALDALRRALARAEHNHLAGFRKTRDHRRDAERAGWGKQNKLGLPYYLLWPFTKVKYVAAEETMNSTWLTKFFRLAGALTVKRTWNEGGKEIQRGLDPSDTRKIFSALENNWVMQKRYSTHN